MSLSIRIKGFVPPDNTWKQMKAVWDACEAADIPVPREVSEFFNDATPDERGVEHNLENSPAVIKYSDAERDGFEVDLSKLKTSIRVIRFYISY